MEMCCQHFFRQLDGFKQLLSQLRMADADCISQTNLIAAHRVELLSNRINNTQVYLPLVGTAHYARYVAAHFYFVFLSYVHYCLESCEALFDRAVYVFLSESLTCSSKYCYFLHLGSQCSLHAFGVRHKNWVADIGMFLDKLKHLCTVCKLGDRLW